MTYAEACAIADQENAKLGLTKMDALEIVASSMAASRHWTSQ